MKALTAAEMREVDRLTTERLNIPSFQLMEAAGKSVADEILAGHVPASVAVLCGKGNNGGDGFVVARYLLREIRNTKVYLFTSTDSLQGDSRKNFELWRNAGGGITVITEESHWNAAWSSIASAELIVDALLGTGLRGPVTGVMAAAIRDLNDFSQNCTLPVAARVVSVDIPSGMPSDGENAEGPVLQAHSTVTFTSPKIGQLVSRDAAACGQLLVRQIGSPIGLVEEVSKQNIRWAGVEEFFGLPLLRRPESHKGTFGHVVLVAGSRGKSGAAVLAGLGSLRSGAGLTTVATAESIISTVTASHPELMTDPLAETQGGAASLENGHGPRLENLLAGKTVLGIGPGLGTHPETQQFVRNLVAETALPIVLDADGLNAFDGHADLLHSRKSSFLAITPHPGEMARLFGISNAEVQADRLKIAREAAKRWEAHVLLKGYHTVLAAPDGRVFVNTTGNAGLAKGGSGDVLTGVLSALTAQFGTKDWLRILALGAYLHGAAADSFDPADDVSGMLASDVAHALPRARAALVEEIRRGA